MALNLINSDFVLLAFPQLVYLLVVYLDVPPSSHVPDVLGAADPAAGLHLHLLVVDLQQGGK